MKKERSGYWIPLFVLCKFGILSFSCQKENKKHTYKNTLKQPWKKYIKNIKNTYGIWLQK